ncbi:class I histocompatibility antigen, F10 alpha chain-like [Discoglossus pictus]
MDKIKAMTMGLILLCLQEPCVCTGAHSLRYYITAVSASCPGLPLYSIVGYIDDIQFERYTSETHRAQPFFQWMEEHVDPEHWERHTKIGQYYEILHTKYARFIHTLFNQTNGQAEDYTFQVKFACEMHKDGTIGGYEEFGFNGKEFIFFDNDRLIHVPSTNEAQILTQNWNSELSMAQRAKHRIFQECIELMSAYITHAKNKLEKKVSPKVKISSQESVSLIKLYCHVYGFYPREVDVKWVKNGVDDVYSEDAKQILPNPDGTYQIRIAVEVTPREGDTYSCHVDHRSLEEILVVKWEPPGSHFLYILIGLILAVVALIAVSGVLLHRRMSGRGDPVNTEERD